MAEKRCHDCGRILTPTEAHYYGDRCEACETAWSARITAWRTGETVEPELDAYFAGPPTALSKAGQADGGGE